MVQPQPKDAAGQKQEKQLIVSSLNIEGLKSNVIYSHEVLKYCQILCLQEHWLLNFECNLMDEYFPSHNYIIKCVDDASPSLPKFRSRGTAGTAIIWHKDIDHLVQPLSGGSDRLCMISIQTTPTPTVILNTYMPTTGAATSDYQEVLAEVLGAITQLRHATVIWTGDINADPFRKSTKNDHHLEQFCEENHLSVSKHTPLLPTFHHFNGVSTSTIDLFIHCTADDPIASIRVIARHSRNTSMHDAITAYTHMYLDTNASPAIKRDPEVSKVRKIQWTKLDKTKYQEMAYSKLQALSNQLNDLPSELITARLNTILVECAEAACPPPPERRRNTTYRWHASFKAPAKNANTLYRAWKEAGSPKTPNNPHLSALKAAKKILRRAQRQAAARRRKDIKQAIITSCKTKDRRDFYKHIRKQKKPGMSQATIEFGDHADPQGAAYSWANYYAELASPLEDETFDEEHKQHLQITYLLQVLTTRGQPVDPVTPDDIVKHVAKLKNGKACDIYGVAAEHLKLSPPSIINILCHLTNLCLNSGKLPQAFKLGSVTPVHKKAKPYKQPSNHRRITITSLIGKVIERQMLRDTRPILDPAQSSSQYGYTEGVPPTYAAIVLTEVIAEALDNKTELIVTFLDTSKAFDVVDHRCMLNAMHQQGVRGGLWQLYNSLYSGIKSVVKWRGDVSDPFEERQGIRQGGITSADCYKGGKNRLLKTLNANPSMKTGSLASGAVMVADDLAISARNQHSMQEAINIAQIDASRDRYKFNTEKTKTITINCKLKPTLTLNNRPLQLSQSETHLGIQRSCDGKNILTVECRVKDATRAAYSMRNAGLHGFNGCGPEVVSIQYDTYIIPTLTYGLDALVLDRKELDILEAYHRKSLRYIQHLPQSTAIPAIHLLLGIGTVEMMIDIKVLKLFRNIAAADPKSPPALFIQEFIRRQLAVTAPESKCWTRRAEKALAKYQLPSPYSLFENPPKKLAWKRRVKTAVQESWTDKLIADAEDMSSLEYLNLDACEIGSLHPTWQEVNNQLDIQKATVKTQLLIKRYPLATSPTAGINKSDLCPLCKQEPETTTHFILHCPSTRLERLPYLLKILATCRSLKISIDVHTLTQVILDSTHLPCQVPNHEKICRNMLFKIHSKRGVLLGGGSAYILARYIRK